MNRAGGFMIYHLRLKTWKASLIRRAVQLPLPLNS